MTTDIFYCDLNKLGTVRVDRITIGGMTVELVEPIFMPPDEIRLCDANGQVVIVIRNVGGGECPTTPTQS